MLIMFALTFQMCAAIRFILLLLVLLTVEAQEESFMEMRLHFCISRDRNNHFTQTTECNVNSCNKDIVSFCYQTLISAGKMKSVPYY